MKSVAGKLGALGTWCGSLASTLNMVLRRGPAGFGCCPIQKGEVGEWGTFDDGGAVGASHGEVGCVMIWRLVQ